MTRILTLCAAAISLVVITQATAQKADALSTTATSEWLAHVMVAGNGYDCLVDPSPRATPDPTSRLSDMLLQHRAVSRLPFNPDIATQRSEPETVDQPNHTGQCG